MVKRHLAVAIPASVVSDIPHLREKTSKIGLMGRTASIFQVNEIIVYADNSKIRQENDLDLIAKLLNYMETPQYLRKCLFTLNPALQYAGILPPLRTPHHPLQGKARELRIGDYRDGVIISKARNGLLVDIGVEQAALLGETHFSPNTRLPLKITKLAGQIEVQAIAKEEIPKYWGYHVSIENDSLKALIKKGSFDLTIGTSKFAPVFQETVERLSDRWKKASRTLVLFGAPTRGLHEIAKDQQTNLNNIVDFIVNTIPNQGTETVRTEEALLATLAVLNVNSQI